MRVWNWVERLHAAIDRQSEAPFDYATLNCALFAAENVDAVLGDESKYAEAIRAEFADEAGARAFMDREGGLEAAVTKRLGEPVAWWHLRRGDVALIETPEGPALGTCLGDVIILLGPDGIASLKLDKVLKGWRVG